MSVLLIIYLCFNMYLCFLPGVFSKSYQDKQAWGWAEKTEPCDITPEHVQAAYRMTVEVCQPNKCRQESKLIIS